MDGARIISYNLNEEERPGGMKVRIKSGWNPAGKGAPGRGAEGVPDVGSAAGTAGAGGPAVSPAAPTEPGGVAALIRTSTLDLQDPVASYRRQLRLIRTWLPYGWYVTAVFADVESGGIDIEHRSQTRSWRVLTDSGLKRDGGIADMLTEGASPEPGSPSWRARTSNGRRGTRSTR